VGGARGRVDVVNDEVNGEGLFMHCGLGGCFISDWVRWVGKEWEGGVLWVV
jgi:hypothetical protein